MAFCGHLGILRTNIMLKMLIMATEVDLCPQGAVVVGEGQKECCRG